MEKPSSRSKCRVGNVYIEWHRVPPHEIPRNTWHHMATRNQKLWYWGELISKELKQTDKNLGNKNVYLVAYLMHVHLGL